MIKMSVSKVKVIRDTLAKYIDIPLPIETAWDMMKIVDKLDESVSVIEQEITNIVSDFRDENGDLIEEKKDEMTQKIREAMEKEVSFKLSQLSIDNTEGIVITVRDLKILECLFLK